MITREFKIDGMSCGHCVKAVEIELKRLGIEEMQIQIGSAKIVYDETKLAGQQIAEAISRAGYKII